MKPKFDRKVYFALRDAGYTNRAIAEMLGVDEASVRRGLRTWVPKPAPPQQFVITVTPVD